MLYTFELKELRQMSEIETKHIGQSRVKNKMASYSLASSNIHQLNVVT